MLSWLNFLGIMRYIISVSPFKQESFYCLYSLFRIISPHVNWKFASFSRMPYVNCPVLSIMNFLPHSPAPQRTEVNRPECGSMRLLNPQKYGTPADVTEQNQGHQDGYYVYRF